MQLVHTKIAPFFSEYFEYKIVISMIKQFLHECKQAIKQVKQQTVIQLTSSVPTTPEVI